MDDFVDQIPPDILDAVRSGITLRRLLEITGVGLRRGASNIAEANCPLNTHSVRSPSFRLEATDTEHFWCEQCGAKGGIKEYLSALFCTPAGAIQDGQELNRIFQPLVARLERESLDRYFQVVSQTYGRLLAKLSLYKEHADFLSQRGISERASLDRGFRSLPVERRERVRVCEELVSEGFNLESIAGFFKLPEDLGNVELQARWCFAGDELGRRTFRGVHKGKTIRYEIGGILTPIREQFGTIRALEIFNDRLPSDSPETLRRLWPMRSEILGYTNISGANIIDAGGEFPIHYALPKVQKEQIVWIIEGGLRAEILSALYNHAVIAISSLSHQWEQVVGAMEGFSIVVIGLPSDQISDAWRLYNEAITKGQKAYVIDWNKVQNCSYEDCIIPPAS
jgi:hypothetical protein